MTSGLLLQRKGLSAAGSGCERRTSCVCSMPQRPSMARGRLTVHSMMGTTTTNPALTFGLGKAQDAMNEQRGRGPTELMTVDGAVQKTAILLGVAVLSASYTWMQVFSGVAATAMMALNMGQMAGFVALGSSLATMFKPQWAPYSGLLFAAAEGVTLGAFSSIMELRYPGIVMSAVMLVFGTAATLLAAYQTRLISVTDNFRNGVMMVTGGYMFVLLGSMALRFLGMNLPAIGSGGIVGIGISLVAAALASANLLLDFDMIKRCARMGLPKWMEWYSAFSLMVTLVWLFTEALRLLRMLSSSRDN